MHNQHSKQIYTNNLRMSISKQTIFLYKEKLAEEHINFIYITKKSTKLMKKLDITRRIKS